MLINFIMGDISEQDTEAIVNAANRSLSGGGGVDGAIHRAAGPGLLKECREIGFCDTGDAKLTKGYGLKAGFVIHTVGPIYKDNDQNQAKLLASCYRRSLELAVLNKIKSISFPSISTGAYGYPVEEAAKIAIRELKNFLSLNLYAFDEVRFVLFTKSLFDVFTDTYEKLKREES